MATAEGLPIRLDPMGFGVGTTEGGYWIWDESKPIGRRDYMRIGGKYSPSTNWAQGGPILARSKVKKLHEGIDGIWWAATLEDPHHPISGPTLLIAAMRCYVAAELGPEVEIPDNLLF